MISARSGFAQTQTTAFSSFSKRRGPLRGLNADISWPRVVACSYILSVGRRPNRRRNIPYGVGLSGALLLPRQVNPLVGFLLDYYRHVKSVAGVVPATPRFLPSTSASDSFDLSLQHPLSLFVGITSRLRSVVLFAYVVCLCRDPRCRD
jgi:hypothetical protein